MELLGPQQGRAFLASTLCASSRGGTPQGLLRGATGTGLELATCQEARLPPNAEAGAALLHAAIFLQAGLDELLLNFTGDVSFQSKAFDLLARDCHPGP